MARANLPAPEDISGQRSLGTPFTDAGVKARPFGTFNNPKALVIPNAPEDNALKQLGGALSRFNPALNQYAVANIKQADEIQTAKGHADYQKVRKDYAEAVEANDIPAGASRAYVEAYKATELNTKQMLFGNSLHKAYEESGLRDSDDPNAMQQLLAEHTKKFRAGALMRGGNDRYTTLELAHSKFDEGLQGQVSSLMAQHIQYRANERTEIGKQTAMTNAGLRVDELYDATNPASLSAVAAAFKDTFFDPMKGIGKNGIPKSEVNKLMVDTLATKMVEMGDDSVADIAKHIDMGPGSKLAGWTYAKNKFKEASNAIMTEKIRNSNWNWTERDRKANLDAGITPESEAQRKVQLMNEHDEGIQRQLKEYHDKGTMEHTKAQSNASVSYILKGLDLHQMNSPHVKKSFDWLRDNDTTAWMHMSKYVADHKKEKAAFVDTRESDLATATLRYDMSRDPMGFKPSEIMAKANNGRINPKSVQTLMDDWDKARLHFDNPFLQNDQFKTLVGDLRKVAINNEADQFKRALNANAVETQLRRNANNWLSTHPKGDFADFMKAMTEQSQPLALEASPEFAKQEAKKQSKVTNPQPVPQKDTRSTMEKILPTAMGGKAKPAPVTAPAGPAPMKPSEAFEAMKPDVRSAITKMMLDPLTDETDLEAALYNGLWPAMKSNGRSSAEFQELKDTLVKHRKK